MAGDSVAKWAVLLNGMKLNMKKHLKLIIAISVMALWLLGVVLYCRESSPAIGASSDPVMGGAYPDSRWLVIDKFSGYQTKQDPTKLAVGANPNGQNTVSNDGDRISSRNFGYEVMGTTVATEEPITSLHTFRRRDGENILIRTRGTYIEYYEEAGNEWESLISTTTPNLSYGWADYNINSDLVSYTYFGNSADPFMRWTGAHTGISTDVTIGDAVINVIDAYDFAVTGTIRYCGTTSVYTSKTDTTITLSGTALVDCAANRGVAQAVVEFPSLPRGNMYLVSSNRIFIAGVTSTPQAVYFSKYGNAETYLTTLVASSTAAAAGIFNLGEGGGGVTGMAQDEGAVYIFKKNITYRVTLDDSLYTLTPLKPFDGKSQTTGCVNRRMIFTGANGTYFVTPDNQIMTLSRVESYDYPQITPISYMIQPTVNDFDFSSGAGIFWKQSAFIAAKSTSDSASPDTVLIHNAVTGMWESPLVGWAVSDFAIYDDGTGETLYFGDANTANVYKVIADPSDNGLAFSSAWRSKQFTFSEIIPQSQLKEMDSVYVEGYISDNTDLTISLLLDEDGSTQKFSTTFSGATDSAYIFSANPYNIFGLQPFGYMRFGSSDQANLKKFRVYLSKDFRAYPFYNAQIEFGSNSDGQQWEVTAFGFRVRGSSLEEKRTLYKSFK